MDAWILSTLAFFAAFLMVFAANAVLQELSAGERRRLNRELREQLRQQQRERIKALDLSQIASLVQRPKFSVRRAWEDALEQSGLNVASARLLLIAAGLAGAGALFSWALTASLLLSVFAVLVGAALPPLYVLYARHKRLEKLLAQLPNAFDLMSRVLRAGHTIARAMQFVADEFSPPISLEFMRCQEQMNLGLSPEAALRDMAQRTGLLEIKIFAVAVLVQRQTGGNLSELFDKMSTVIRDRSRIRGMIQSLTAQGRMQAIILLSLPPAMFLLLMAVNPEYELTLLQYPTLIVAALSMMSLGAFWINRIVHFDF